MKRYSMPILLVATLAVAAFPVVGAAQSTDVLFQEAQRLERVQGDYQGAIGIYQQIVGGSSTERTSVARALVQMGKAYESLGRTEAFSVYERVVRDFADVDEQVSEARSRMRGLAVPTSPTSTPDRTPGEISEIPFHGDRDNGRYMGIDMSPDGRYLVFGSGTEPFLQEIETGENIDIPLTPEDCYSSGMRFAPDGETIAYGCWGGEVGIYDRDAGQTRQILNGQEYLGLDAEGPASAQVVDWSENGDSLAVSIYGSLPEESGSVHNFVGLPVDGGTPRIVDTSHSSDGHYFSMEHEACWMRNNRFLFGTWWFNNEEVERVQNYVQRIAMSGVKRTKVLYDSSTNITLFGCDKERNILYYASDFPAMAPTLWAAFVEEDGSLSRKQFLADLPRGVAAHRFSQSGNLSYTIRNLGNSGDNWHGRLSDSGAQYLGQSKAWTLDWTEDGRFRAERTGFTEVKITNIETDEVRTHDLGHSLWTLAWFPGGERFLASHWPNGDSGRPTRSWVHDAQTGALVDSIDGVRAFATTADGEGVVFPEVTDDGVCVTSMRLADRTRTHLRCFPEATFIPRTTNAWEMSRSRDLIWLNYGLADSTNIYRIVSLDGSVDYELRDGRLSRNIEFLPDDSGAIIIETRALFFLDLATGIETEIASGLPPNMFHSFYGWKLHPDGGQFAARLEVSRQATSSLTVINNPAGLFDGAK